MNPFDTLFGVVISRLLVEANADVAVVGRDKAALPQAAAHLDDVGAGLFFGVHRAAYSLRHFSLQKCTGVPPLTVLIALPGTT